MARKSLEMPTGVELVGNSVRIRFMWNGKRRCETLALPATPKGIAAAAGLRDQVVGLAKLGILTEDKYAELFPSSSYTLDQRTPTFGNYAQTCIDSRQIVKNTRDNYARVLNKYWMPKLATMLINAITSLEVRKIVQKTTWPSATDRRFAINTLSGIFKSAMADELISKNPATSIPRAKVQKPEVDPFLQSEADQVIDYLYASLQGTTRIYAAYFEFAFYTGMRPCEIMALRWSEVDEKRRRARACRVMVRGEIHERIKTKYSRDVLLNSRALKALGEAKKQTQDRPYVFAPAEGGDYIHSDSTPKPYLNTALEKLGIRYRRPYATRHTYATVCLMAGMTPAFVAKQLGHSVQVLLETYAKWIDSEADFLELDKLESGKVGTNLVRCEPETASSA